MQEEEREPVEENALSREVAPDRLSQFFPSDFDTFCDDNREALRIFTPGERQLDLPAVTKIKPGHII